MKYVNAEKIFPKELLIEIQKYVHGELVYVPKPDGLRMKWGEQSGSRSYLKHRNEDIRQRFAVGESIEQLSDEFFLSSYSIKKIVYSKK